MFVGKTVNYARVHLVSLLQTYSHTVSYDLTVLTDMTKGYLALSYGSWQVFPPIVGSLKQYVDRGIKNVTESFQRRHTVMASHECVSALQTFM